MNISELFTLFLFALLFIFPLGIYLNLVRHDKASLGLLINKKVQTKRVFQIFAISMILYALSMLILIIVDLYSISIFMNIYIIISVIITIALIYVFYRLYRITKI